MCKQLFELTGETHGTKKAPTAQGLHPARQQTLSKQPQPEQRLQGPQPPQPSPPHAPPGAAQDQERWLGSSNLFEGRLSGPDIPGVHSLV